MRIQPTTMNSQSLCLYGTGAKARNLRHFLRNQFLYCKNNDKSLIKKASSKATDAGVKFTKLILDIFQGNSSSLSRNKTTITQNIVSKNSLNYIV